MHCQTDPDGGWISNRAVYPLPLAARANTSLKVVLGQLSTLIGPKVPSVDHSDPLRDHLCVRAPGVTLQL